MTARILLATTANHVLAATVGVWVSRLLPSTAVVCRLSLRADSSTDIHRFSRIPRLPTCWG